MDIWFYTVLRGFWRTYSLYFGIVAWEEDIWAGVLGEIGGIWMDQRDIWDMFASDTVVVFVAWQSS